MAMNPVTREIVTAAGGPAKLAIELRGRDGKPLTRQAVEQWTVVPPRHVLRVEALTGISRHRQRPDLYGPEPKRPLRRRARGEQRSVAQPI